MLFGNTATFAQGGRYRDKAKSHNLYFRIDLASGNIYPVVTSMATGLFNYWLDQPLFETSYNYSFITAKYNDEKLDVKKYKFNGLTAHDLFNDVQVGIKLGYQTYSTELFNFGLYASGHYKIDQFQIKGAGDAGYCNHNIHRIQLGLNAFTSIGRMGDPLKVSIEAGCRYNIGCLYKNPYDNDTDMLNNGLCSHFALKFAGEGILQDFGVFANFNHYNLLKEKEIIGGVNEIKGWSIGLTFSLTPQQIENKRDYR